MRAKAVAHRWQARLPNAICKLAASAIRRPRTSCSIPISPTSRPAEAGPAWWRESATAPASQPVASTVPICSMMDSGKAPPGKKMLGAVAGGSVRLSAVCDEGHLGVA